MKTIEQHADELVYLGLMCPTELEEMRCEDPPIVLALAVCAARLRQAVAMMRGAGK